ncbi:glycosyltransferase family 4 protein [Trueperella pyogenes]|uniref:glycosyltransferase family 4 protein n=1 Tax=Trueperella pyogenes TaxID=1661 RepID=UPI00057D9FD8|nr:glycosyltransferase family 4 protein [Trueperella pyogenes]AJC69662.1 GDP-mannose-dependent alpha-(1-2)-phosphatidylinositol mannosyltransferase [Trueperella pyogenes TP8]ALD74304.1 alpha-(1-2)-phosphatidylinositol mannosyltransferase [Trueperella pyogenes]
MKIGIACGYSWDVHGGVQYHIRDLAKELIARGHDVSVIAPAENTPPEDFVCPVGAAVPVRYNGSVARLSFGPRVNREVRRWLKEGEFDVLHVHEPFTPSVSMLALMSAECPVVSTFHTAMDHSRMLTLAAPFIVPILDKIQARIAVSAEARRTAVQHLGGDAWVIPNGVFVRDLQIDASDPRFMGTPQAPTLAFLGRLDEPRKGLPVLAHAFGMIRAKHPGVRLLVAGKGDEDEARRMFGEHAGAVQFLGPVSDKDKALLLGSADAYVAPNTGGESFGIILVEAMSAGAFVVASDIPAFRAVLSDGEFGVHFRNEDPDDLARVVNAALDDPEGREQISRYAAEAAWRFDWGTVASHILSVYETAIRTAKIEVEE